MDKTGTPFDISKDVLHIPAQSKLTPEQIAKAVAHHNHKHHPQEHSAQGSKQQPQKSPPGKKMR